MSSPDVKDNENVIANRYKIIKKMELSKRSSDGNTHFVLDTKNNNEMKCLKMIGFSLHNRNEIKEIIREESILSSLSSPYIIKYHESFLYQEMLCIVTEYCEGGDLDQKIKELKKNHIKLPEEKIIHWFSQLTSAVFYIHSNNILHRNIKPANILLKNGMIKLGDFGISKPLREDKDASTFIGTPYYMSPELVKNERYNSKSDIWSVGCVLYELATYQRPFVGDSVYEIFNSVINDETPSIVNLYSKELNRILKKTLIKSPADRPSASEILNEPLISHYVKGLIQRSLDCAKTPDKMAALINSLSCLGDIIDDSAFGEYDDMSTLKASSRNSLKFGTND